MTRESRYEYLKVVQGHYSGSWEDLTASTDKREALGDLRAYRDNAPETAYRVISRRVLRSAE